MPAQEGGMERMSHQGPSSAQGGRGKGQSPLALASVLWDSRVLAPTPHLGQEEFCGAAREVGWAVGPSDWHWPRNLFPAELAHSDPQLMLQIKRPRNESRTLGPVWSHADCCIVPGTAGSPALKVAPGRGLSRPRCPRARSAWV